MTDQTKLLKVGFTGTRKGMSALQQLNLNRFFQANQDRFIEFHHGDCTGADAEAHAIACHYRINKIIVHPPMNNKLQANCKKQKFPLVEILPPLPYINRNHAIVDDTDLLIVAPSTMPHQAPDTRSGTWATYRYACKQDKNILFLFPNNKEK